MAVRLLTGIPPHLCRVTTQRNIRHIITKSLSSSYSQENINEQYKITNLKNQKVYIGQAANLADRWKDHIKAGLGIDTPSNMLYTAMIKDGVENFTFEVLEECERSALNDRETYYIEFYRSQEHGYNMTKGGARK